MPIDELPQPTWRERLQFLALGPRELLLALVCLNYKTFIRAFAILPPRYLEWTSRIRARRAFYRATCKVPAYRQFLSGKGIAAGIVPEMDKDYHPQAGKG